MRHILRCCALDRYGIDTLHEYGQWLSHSVHATEFHFNLKF